MARGKWFGQPSQAASEATQPLPILPVYSADAKKFGLENFGNTCYANSVIQALYFCTPFRDLLIQAPDSSLVAEVPPPLSVQVPTPVVAAPIVPLRRKPERKPSTSEPNGLVLHPPIPGIPSSPPSLFSALRSLFVYISTNPAEKGTVAPRAFIDKLKEFNELFRSTMHQDAHEFLNYLLNKIVEEIEEDRKAAENGTATPPVGEDLSVSAVTFASKIPPTVATTNSGTSPQDATLVHKLFEGVLTSETRCLTCENISSRDESFLDLSIDIEQNASVTACLRQFSASEMLCQKNKFFCDVCCDLQEAEKRMKIKKLPNVLALHLKRFKYQEDVQKYIKLAYRVAFPFELRLFNTVDDIDDADRLFNLFGIVVHIGNGPHHGHYISIIKTMGSWLVFDDDNVYPIQEADIPKYFGESNSGSAYVLYYQAVDIDLPALGLQPPSVPVDEVVETFSHLEASPSAPMNPPLPPGLVEEDNISDTSDAAFPITPPSPTDARQPIDIPTYVEEPEPVPTSTPAKGTKLLSSIMRSPSTSTRPGTSNGADARRSIQSNGPSPSITSDDDTRPLIPPLPLPPPTLPQAVTPNGKEKEKEKRKEPERKASLWFGRRKSFRLGDKDKARSEDEVPVSPVVANRIVDAVTQASSSNWFLSSGHSQDKNRRPSEPFDSPRASRTISAGTRPKSTGGLTVKPERAEGVNGYDSPSPGSASSSFVSVAGSASVSAGPHQSVVEFPPARASSLAPQPLPPPPLPPLPEPPALSTATKPPQHKKSMSNLSSPKDKKSKARGPPTVSPPPRPSTAGPAPGAPPEVPHSTRPLPPVPPITHDLAASSPPVPPTKLLDGDELLAGIPVSSLDKGKTRAEGGDGETDEAPLELPSSPVGLGSFAGANNSTSSTSSSNGSAANAKRATRKMSLTSPLLGLGWKKDKQKDKEKSPSSFHFGGKGV
ncbi:hypothetical protein DFH08DRAFT_371697 [Mycena albidolilacea]|uniref:Ubiquitin carboxyl-terminal hydrolase n=1 Tax=Mycena albidolilacea TaxID=1033008 RepID=A0AAD7F2H8_9AGAR|nr:hypothetical protein DFH08DRAFT_371697 [Mycena albidolilacea]